MTEEFPEPPPEKSGKTRNHFPKMPENFFPPQIHTNKLQAAGETVAVSHEQDCRCKRNRRVLFSKQQQQHL